jgi:hypothetical protein
VKPSTTIILLIALVLLLRIFHPIARWVMKSMLIRKGADGRVGKSW